MSRRIAVILAALVLAGACTSSPQPRVAPSPSPSPVISPAPSPSPARRGPDRFEADRAYRTIQALASGIGPRESAGDRYAKAADLIASAFQTLGYSVERQNVAVPEGMSGRVPVPAGTTQNVIAEPPDFDASVPHLLVGAHLDTVAGSPGANDNASGVAVMMELARLVMVEDTAMPIVWVAFGGEERRRPGFEGTTYGSRHYLSSMTTEQQAALKGVVVLDVVGRGQTVYVCSGGKTTRPVLDALTATAKRLGVASKECTISRLYSDHAPFERAGYPVGWLWTGEFSQVHTGRDVVGIVDKGALDRTGRIAWETLRFLSL